MIFSALLLESCHSVQYPLEGCKNKKMGSVYKAVELQIPPRHFHPSRGYYTESRLIFPFTRVSGFQSHEVG